LYREAPVCGFEFLAGRQHNSKTHKGIIEMTPERLKWIISGLDRNALTDRELKFLENCEDMMGRKGFITWLMEEWTEEIYREKSR